MDPDNLIISMPLLLLSVPAVVIGLFLMFSSAQFRTGFLVFGALLALGGSDIDATKVIYLCGALVAFLVALSNARNLDSYDRSLMRMALAIGAMTATSLGVAIMNGTSLGAWSREAIALCLLAATPIFVIDLRHQSANRMLVPIFVIGGLVAAVSWSVSWLSRRGLGGLDTDTFLMPSFMFPAALFAYATAGVLSVSRYRILWMLLAIGVLGCILITATRSSWGYLAIPVFVSLALSGSFIRAILKIGIFTTVVLLMSFAFLQYLGSATKSDVSKIQDRLFSTAMVVQNPSSDGSMIQRAAETFELWRAFVSSPIVGVGLGYRFTYVVESPMQHMNRTREDTGLVDSPLALPAKFGLMGLLLTAIAGAAVGSLSKATEVDQVRSQAGAAAISYALFSMLMMLIVAIFTDKGMAFGFLFLLALNLPARDPGEAQVIP